MESQFIHSFEMARMKRTARRSEGATDKDGKAKKPRKRPALMPRDPKEWGSAKQTFVKRPDRLPTRSGSGIPIYKGLSICLSCTVLQCSVYLST